MAATALIHREAILLSIASGKRLTAIANSLGMRSPSAISNILKDDPAYREAIEQGYCTKLDAAEDQIQSASEAVDVTRARAYWSAISWRAGVEVPHRWGSKQLLLHEHRVDVSDRLQADLSAILGRVVSTQRNEGECLESVLCKAESVADTQHTSSSHEPAMLDQVDDLDPLDPAT